MTTPVIGAQAAQVNLLVNQKASYHARFRWQVDGVPQSLSGYRAVLGIAARKGRATLVQVTSDPDDGILLEPDDGAGPLTGVIDVLLTQEQTSLLVKTSYVYDMILIDSADDSVTRLFEGSVSVDLGISSA